MSLTKNLTPTLLFATALSGLCASAANAHDGRRLDIQINDDQLWAQGYISGSNPNDDGGGVTRPYLNAIHGHWTNNPSPAVEAASATLPGFDLFDGGSLTGFDLTLTLTGARKWVAPPVMPPAGTVPELVALGPGEEIFVTFAGEFVSTNTPGTLTLIENVSSGGLLDIDLTYDIAAEPEAVLYVLEFVLATTNTTIADSETISIILSPDGNSPQEKLHHASLYLESQLGIIPAPGVASLLGLSCFGVLRRRRAA